LHALTKVLVLALLAVLSAGTSAGPQGVDPIDDLFARGRAAQAAVTSLSASFVETTVSSLLRNPIIDTGTMVAARPVRVLMKYSGPDAKTVLLDETRLVVSWPSRAAREQIDITDIQRRVQKYFVEASTQELRQSFEIVLTSDPKVGDAYRLTMTPKRKQIKEGLERIRIWIDRERLIMVKMTLDYPGGESKTLELHDIRFNVPIDASTFVVPGRGRTP
jgi:outer membrane lipoprotein-sorting protein